MPKPGKKKAVAAPPPARPAVFAWIETFPGRWAVLLAIGLIAVASARVVTTYTVFNHTSDEPSHIACGMQWLSEGVYRYEHQHPPLSRVMMALGPYLAGARSNHQTEMDMEGNTILYGGHQYDLRLALARAGNLPFLWLASWMVFLWGRRIVGPAGAVLATLVFTMIPVVLAHAGLATTDMAVTACFAAAAYTSVRFAEEPGPKTAVWLGLAMGLMVLSKFSALVYYPAALVLTLAFWIYFSRSTFAKLKGLFIKRLPWLGAATILGFLVVWAGYRFSFGKTVWIPFPVPAPELLSGIKAVADHNSTGHLSYFLGEQSMSGWWTFFPVLLAVKLPLAMLALLAVGLWKLSGRPKATWPFYIAIAAPAAILIVAMPSRINIGLRHILPALPFLAVIAASGTLWLIKRRKGQSWMRWAAVAALLWMCVSSIAAHPDYLPYFNALAGDRPERIVVDSDLDWGQDIKRLGQRLRELNAPSVAFTPTIRVSLAANGFPPHEHSAADVPSTGWNAVQISQWKLYRMGLQLNEPKLQLWPEVFKPVERVGHSILLYYVPPQQSSSQ